MDADARDHTVILCLGQLGDGLTEISRCEEIFSKASAASPCLTRKTGLSPWEGSQHGVNSWICGGHL